MGVVETAIDGVVVEGEPGAGGLLAQDTEIEVMIVMTINTVRTIFFIVIRVTPLIMITFILDQLKLYIKYLTQELPTSRTQVLFISRDFSCTVNDSPKMPKTARIIKANWYFPVRSKM